MRTQKKTFPTWCRSCRRGYRHAAADTSERWRPNGTTDPTRNMWRLNKVRHKSGRQGDSLEELRLKRREHERALRQARRDRQLVSRRLLLTEDEDQAEVTMDTASEGQGVVDVFHKIHHSGPDREAHMKVLSKALRDPSAQLTFIKLENSMHLLVGLLTGSDARCRLQAARCLHELSRSPHRDVAPACLPATSYLLTYLSGQSTRFTELCLYTLGNLCPDSEVVQQKLLAQGIIPALASCMEIQRHNPAVVEAVGFTLSQLLQTNDAAVKVIPTVLASSLPAQLLSVLAPDPNFALAPAIESAWCLHYLTSSSRDNKELLSRGALLQCSSLLVSLGGAEGNKEEGLELLVCPLLRCVGNLLCCCPVEELNTAVADPQLVICLCALLQNYLQTQPALARESAWVLNNLTAHSNTFCSALLTFNLVSGMIHLLPFSQGINTLILRVLANIAHKKKDFCVQLAQLGLLSALCATLKMADQEMVTLSLDVLFMLVVSAPQVAEEFVQQGGVSLLEAIQYNSEGEMRGRATYLLEHHLLSQ
ncbi:transmembrane and coiled-coil domain-containing protein 6-like [Betta splendens]|uniref:Transmembrane and coiled-coil domain-containing protein 6-like n=1 Tax=Betta splendens TaxID=158456 RepID=A0A6P7NQU6_BETSP|nr:transmembrane and coiled-coil domain-containing protein 6-like [Betta splendens]